MAVGDMFCFGAGFFGVREYERTSDQGTPEEGTSFDQRASFKTLAAKVRH